MEFRDNQSRIDVTSIGQTVTQTAPFRTFISGFADGSGSASVYSADDDTLLSSRMVEDVIQRQQASAKRLYIDRQMSGANVIKTQVDQFWQILSLLLQVLTSTQMMDRL